MKRRRKHWRAYIVNNQLPPKFELADKYKPLIEKLVLIATGQSIGPGDMYKRFKMAFGRTGDLSLQDYLSAYRDVVCDQEDLVQQCYMYLMEIWEWARTRWGRSDRSIVFYDYVRFNLPKYLGTHLVHLINSYNAELAGQAYLLEEPSYELEDPPIFHLNLSWVVLRSKDGIFSNLTTKQKYLLYLRYNRGYTIDKISSLIQQHRARVEQEFSSLNKIIGDYYHATTRTNPKEPN